MNMSDDALLQLYIGDRKDIRILFPFVSYIKITLGGSGGSVGFTSQSDSRPSGDQEIAGLIPSWTGNIVSWTLKYFLSLPLVQKGQLSVSAERIYTSIS